MWCLDRQYKGRGKRKLASEVGGKWHEVEAKKAKSIIFLKYRPAPQTPAAVLKWVGVSVLSPSHWRALPSLVRRVDRGSDLSPLSSQLNVTLQSTPQRAKQLQELQTAVASSPECECVQVTRPTETIPIITYTSPINLTDRLVVRPQLLTAIRGILVDCNLDFSKSQAIPSRQAALPHQLQHHHDLATTELRVNLYAGQNGLPRILRTGLNLSSQL